MRSDFNQIVCIENDIYTGICKYLSLMINYLYTYLSLYVMCILFYYWIQVDDKLFIHLFKPVCNVYFILLLDTGG